LESAFFAGNQVFPSLISDTFSLAPLEILPEPYWQTFPSSSFLRFDGFCSQLFISSSLFPSLWGFFDHKTGLPCRETIWFPEFFPLRYVSPLPSGGERVRSWFYSFPDGFLLAPPNMPQCKSVTLCFFSGTPCPLAARSLFSIYLQFVFFSLI